MSNKAKRQIEVVLAIIFLGIAVAAALPYGQADPVDEHIARYAVIEEKQTVAATSDKPTEYTPDAEEVELIGRTIWGEAGGVRSQAERAAVAWCILNRVDARQQTVAQVVTAPRQFHGYRATGDCPQEHLDLAADVLTRWQMEKDGANDVGRTLPADYLYFYGDGERNHFSVEWLDGDTWDWSLPNPYNIQN